jgi:ABC-type nitrate/sulfonate/bicarbonate transport system permease component
MKLIIASNLVFILRKSKVNLILLALLLVWQFLSITLFNPLVIPSPLTILNTAWDMILSKELMRSIGISLFRVFIGYGLGSVIGIALGILIGRFKIFENLLSSPFDFIRGIPPIALVPLAIILFGIGETSKVFIIFYIVVIVVCLNTITGVKEVPKVRIRAALCLGISRSKLFTRIIIPSAMRHILTGLRNAVGFSFMALVSAELIAANEGIGFIIMDSRFTMQTARMFVGLLTLGICGALLQTMFDKFAQGYRKIARYKNI